MTRHSQILELLGAAQSITSEREVICCFCIVCFEILRECHLRRLNQFHVTSTLDYNLHCDGIVSFHMLRTDIGGDSKRTYRTRKVRWLVRQRTDVESNLWSGYLLLYLNNSTSTIEECLNRVNITILLNDDSFVGNGWYDQIARLLGEEHILTPHDSMVNTSVVVLKFKLFGVRKWNLLNLESIECRQFAVELSKIHQ